MTFPLLDLLRLRRLRGFVMLSSAVGKKRSKLTRSSEKVDCFVLFALFALFADGVRTYL